MPHHIVPPSAVRRHPAPSFVLTITAVYEESSVKLLTRLFAMVAVIVVIAGASSPAHAQTPNTSTVAVLVTDQSGAVIRDANVSVTNTQTGDVHEAMSGADGRATFPAL